MKVLFFFRNAEWLGIEYLSSALQAAGHQTDLVFDPGSGDVEMKVGLLNTTGRFQQKVKSKIQEFQPDLVAFSVLTNLYPWVCQTAKLVKGIVPRVSIIAGGLHPTMFPEVVLQNPDIDFICQGEGEDALVELVEALERGETEFPIDNIWYKKEDRVISNPLRPLRHDLDELPFPDKDMFYKHGCFRDRLYIMTGRGCPYQCAYCFNHTYKKLYAGKGKYIRQRSVANCIAEIKHYQKRYRVRELFFYDDTFTLDPNWVEEFTTVYRKEIALPYAVNVRANTVTPAVVKMLKESGCFYVVMGVESGNEHVRNDILKRGLSNEVMRQAATVIHDAGLKLCTLNIVGVPTETEEQMWETVEFNHSLKPDGGSMASTFYPFPKTDLYFFAREKGLLSDAACQLVDNGTGGYRESTILAHPAKKTIDRVVVFEPIMVRMPKIVHPLFKRLPPWSIFRLVSVFFYTPLRHLKSRAKEFFLMQYFFRRNK